MVFWIGVLVAATLAWHAIKMGFYETWVLFFNIIVAVYLSIFLAPIVVDLIPAAGGETPYSALFTLTSIAVAAFLILHGVTYIFFTSQFKVSFPKTFNILLSAFLGFWAGLLIWSFITVLIAVTPIPENTFVKRLGFSRQAYQPSINYLAWWCDKLNNVISTSDSKLTTSRAIELLLEKPDEKTPPETPQQSSQPQEPPSESSQQNKTSPLMPPQIIIDDI